MCQTIMTIGKKNCKPGGRIIVWMKGNKRQK